ncbi:MAG TPA: hypothetical protein VK563_17675 [Puia sp.]|nr:hypothetical protein [Puia sp.]
MKIRHIVSHDWTLQQVKKLASLGIQAEKGQYQIIIEEGEVFEKLRPYLKEWEVDTSVSTQYNKKDIAASSLLAYIGSWVNGYPQPEDVPGYRALTYDLSGYCTECGMGAVQKAPFRIKAPKWGEKKLFELNWVFDEIFVRQDIYDSLFMKAGVDSWPVLSYKKDTVIDNVVQLKLPESKVPLLLDHQPFEVCATCGQKKYSRQIRGYFPKFRSKLPAGLSVFKSKEWFGSDARAFKQVFITKKIYEQLEAIKVRPNVRPVDPG